MVDDVLTDAERLLRGYAVENWVVRAVIQELRKSWGGGQVYIQAIDRPARDEAIRAALDQGLKPEQVARKTGASVATVRRRRSAWL